MRHPTQPEDSMMTMVMLSVFEDASRLGAGVGRFHGYEFRALRLGGRARQGFPVRVHIVVIQDGEMVGARDFDAPPPCLPH